MTQLPANNVQSALAAPFLRISRLDDQERAASVALGLLGWIADPVLWFGLAILVGFGLWDWILGTRLAHQRGEYDGDRAYNGLLSKVTGVVLVVGLRALVEYLRASGVPMPADMTVQAAAAVLTGALIVSEVKSIGEKQVQLGGGSIAPLIRLLDRLIGIRREGEER